MRSRTPSGSQERRTPQCEVILTHSLVCRKTKREFIVTSSPDAAFVANLAKHIRMIQPGQVDKNYVCNNMEGNRSVFSDNRTDAKYSL